MILVDTSVWIDHLRLADRHLAGLLRDDTVVCHPFVVGEIACGGLKRRAEVLTLLESLPQLDVAAHAEVLDFIDANKLMGLGLGWIDVHLLAAARLAGERLWTRDRTLAQAARRLGVGA